MRVKFFCLAAVLGVLLPGAAETIKSGPWEFRYDDQTGDWLALTWKGQAIFSETKNKAPSVDLQTVPGKGLIEQQPTASRLQKHSLNGHTLVLARHCGDWDLEETIVFGAAGSDNRIARSLRATYAPPNGKTEPVKFYRARFATPLPQKGTYLFPMAAGLSDKRTANCQTLPAGFRATSAAGVGPLLLNLSPSATLLFVNDGRRDPASTSLQVKDDATMHVLNSFEAAGWAYPQVPQQIGPAYLEVSPNDLETALHTAIWSWYDAIGLKVPANRPAWISQSALYSFHPSGTIGSGMSDLGGFNAARTELIPRVQQLGFGALWLLPLEDRSAYWPRDYYKFQPNLGTGDDYKQLVAAAHRLGLKVWQDLVPHGGSPSYGELRGDQPWWLIFDEHGDAMNYWCFDFREPAWQQRIAQVANYYVRNYDIDGYRIDAVGGSHGMNWRRAGFPSIDQVPANVPAEWWKKSLQAAGGKVPALPYERGSLTQREGGLQMLRAIRDQVKSLKPAEGAILAEVQRPPYMQETDVLYDFELGQRLLNLRKLPAAEFVREIQRFLEEQKCAEPRGTKRLRYIESHDTVRSQGWYGVNAKRALFALTAWIDGMPMLYHDADFGHGPALQQILGVRAALPELQSGDAAYEAVKTDAPAVFTCLRSLPGSNSLVAINLSSEPCTATIALPKLPDAHSPLVVYAATTGQRLAAGPVEKISSIKLSLKPWESQVLCLRSANDPAPKFPAVESFPAATVAAGSAPKVTSRDNLLEVANSAYRLQVDRSTGLLRSFANAKGDVLLNSLDLALDNRLAAPKSAPAFKQSEEAQALVLAFELPLANNSHVTLQYHCFSDRVALKAVLDDQGPAQRAALVTGAPASHRFQVHTAEGVLDDWFAVRHRAGKPSHSTIYYRDQGTAAIWENAITPLDPARAILRNVQTNGSTLEISVPDVFVLANAMLLDHYAERDGWHAAFFWRDTASPTPNHGNALEIQLRPNFTDVKSPEKKSVEVTHTSLDWQIDNPHYRVWLHRTGGTIRSLWSKKNQLDLVAADHDLYTDHGFRTERSRRAAAANDVETASHYWREGEQVHVQFSGLLRDGDRFGILQPPIRFVTEYVFDGSPTFRVRSAFQSQGQVKEDAAFIASVLRVPDSRHFQFARGNTTLFAGDCGTANRAGETAKSKDTPDRIIFSDNTHQPRLVLSDLQFKAPAAPRNLFQRTDTFYLAWLDGQNQKLVPGQWYEFQMNVTAGAAQPAGPATLPWLAEANGNSTPGFLSDASFEGGGAAGLVSLATSQTVALPGESTTAKAAWNFPARGKLDRTIAHSGQASARVENPNGEYALFTQLLSHPEQLKGKKVRLSAWVKGENIAAGKEPWMIGSLGISYKTPDGRWQHGSVIQLKGTFDWRQQEAIIAIPENAKELTLRAGLNGATGVMWIDDIEVTP